MATKEEIEMDLKQALKQADKIDAAANQLGNLSGREFRGSLDNLSASWKGECASMYLAKGGRLQEQMDSTARELHAAAADVRALARRLYDAEMNAWRIATSRSY